MSTTTMTRSPARMNDGFRPSRAFVDAQPYEPPADEDASVLRLDRNEGPPVSSDLLGRVRSALDGPTSQRYPTAARLERRLARRFGFEPDQVVVTAGGDDAIDRCCRVALEPGRNCIIPTPTFEMIGRSAIMAGATVTDIAWGDGPFPTEAILSQADGATGLIAIVSPNNPTGAVVSRADIERIAEACPGALIMLDLAYVEFADDDPTDLTQRYPNIVAIRTFSKARGLAGLRVGYAIGSAIATTRLRAAGSPYPTSGLSLQLAAMSIATDERRVEAFVERVRLERRELVDLLTRLGAAPLPSQANFVLARFDDAEDVGTRLLEQGVAVRRFDAAGPLASALRITCPGDAAAFERLITALKSACNRQGDAS